LQDTPPLPVTIIRSPKRRKTAQARMVDGRLEVRIPARASKAEEARLVEQFRRGFGRAETAAEIDLARRARRLAKAHDLPRPTDIRWVSNQAHRWGSCTPSTGVIRISDRLAAFPPWVIDHVIVHELAHLVERRHDARFHALVARYPLAERAEGYLLAKSGEVDPTADPLAGDVDDETEDRPDEPPAVAPRRRPRGAGRTIDDAPRLPFDA
jgi:predicted metal-dependent hydrolase